MVFATRTVPAGLKSGEQDISILMFDSTSFSPEHRARLREHVESLDQARTEIMNLLNNEANDPNITVDIAQAAINTYIEAVSQFYDFVLARVLIDRFLGEVPQQSQ